MRTYLLLLLALLAGSGCVQAQNTLSGTVRTLQNQPLDGAHIHIEQLHGVSSPTGYYEVHGLTNGEHRVVISYIGYKSLDTIIDFRQNMILDASLKPESTQLQEVVLNNTQTISKNVTHEQKLKSEVIDHYSNATLGDALKEISGVSSLKTGTTIVKPVINGLHSSRVPVIANNVRLEDQQWGTEHAPNLDINSAGKVSVIKGASALQYGGDAIGGLVLVEPVSVLKDTLFGKSILTADSNGRGGSLATSLHKGNEKGWAWNAYGTFKYMGDRETPDYILSNTGNREGNFSGDLKYLGDNYDLSGSYSYYNAKIGIAKATHIGNVSDLVRAINSGQPDYIAPFTYDIDVPRQEVQHHLAKLNYNQELENNASLSMQYAFQLNKRKEFDIRRGEWTDVPALDLTLATHSAQVDWKQDKGDNTFKAGISGSYQKNESATDTGVRPLIPNYTKYDAGAYGIASHRFNDSFSGEAGLRYDFSHMDADKYYQKTRWTAMGYDGEFDDFIVADYGTQWLTNPKYTFHNISASLGIKKQFNETYSLFANAGLAMRNPNPAELFSDGLHHSNGTIELGDLHMDKETSYKVSATLVRSNDTFSFEVTPYVNLINNFIYLKPTGVEYTTRGAFPVYRYSQANALLTGADITANWQINKNFKYTLNTAYVYGQNTDDDVPLIDMPPLNIINTIRYTKPEWNSFYAELRSESVFRQGRYPDYNFYTDVLVDGELVPTLVDVSTPPPGYSLLHFNTGLQFPLGKVQASANFAINNIFNTSYRDYLNRQRLYTDEVGRNFQLQLKFNY